MLPVDPARYALFASVMAVFAITPGPANLFAIATGMHAGPRAALLGVAGMNTATLVWFGAAALGLGALVAAFPAQFHLIAIAGGLYVAWLGLKSLWNAYKGAPPLKASGEARRASAFRDGFAVQLSNPKAVIFFTAVLPPFVDPARPLLPQLATLGATMIAMDTAAMSFYGVAGGALSRTLNDVRAARAFAAFVGVLLLIASTLILLRH
jgi:threonine/homoserine/homoserine lactone efflux protein